MMPGSSFAVSRRGYPMVRLATSDAGVHAEAMIEPINGRYCLTVNHKLPDGNPPLNDLGASVTPLLRRQRQRKSRPLPRCRVDRDSAHELPLATRLGRSRPSVRFPVADVANQPYRHCGMTDRTPFDALMHEVCVEQGWCGSVVADRPMHVTDLLPKSGTVTADQFVGWLFEADGVNPDEDRAKWQSHIDGLREAFIRHMGELSVDVQRLAWPTANGPDAADQVCGDNA